MDAKRWNQVSEIFAEALALPSRDRERLLSERCGNDRELVAEVRALLDADGKAEGFLDTPAAAAAPAAENLVGRVLGPYEIVSVIGAGGMGDVYRARDTRLDRVVALKVLPQPLNLDPKRLARFQTEARAASALNHPNIAVVHDVGTFDDGRAYFVTEFVEGQTLGQRLKSGPLAPAEAVNIAAQIASALAAAHAHGIVHRDIKPDNIIVRPDGFAKLVDFGIAKLAETRTAASPRQTQPGLIIGTPQYMAPEQARGLDVDARGDIWSLGAVLFEMLSGHPPFEGLTASDVLAAILERPAPAMGDAPVGLERVIRKALAKDARDRYQTADEFRHALELARSEPARPIKGWMWAAAAAALVIAAVGSMVWRSRQPSTAPTTAEAPPAALSDSQARVVVLPFENLSGNAADDWLAGGFSDTLTFALQKLPAFTIVTRDRVAEVYQSQGIKDSARLDPARIASVSTALGVQYYVHGTYQRVGNRLRVIARLTAAGSGEIKTQESATDSIDQVLRLEDDLANRFAKALGGSASDVTRGQPRSVEAYRVFTEGRTLWERSAAEAVPVLSRVVGLDPNYEQAWALLSKAHSRLAAPSQQTTDEAALREHRRQGLRAAERAVALAPAYADAHTALALAYRANEQVGPWRTEAQKAIELNPRTAEAYMLLGDSFTDAPLYTCNRIPDYALAEAYFRTALRVDPTDHRPYQQLVALKVVTYSPETPDILKQLLAIHPTDNVGNMAHAQLLLSAKQLDAAEEALRLLDHRVIYVQLLDGWLHSLRGNRREARRVFALARNTAATWPLLSSAQTSFLAGDVEMARDLLSEAIAREPSCGQFAAASRAFAPLREHPSLAPLFASAR